MAERKIETYDVLVLKPQSKPVYFVVKSVRWEDESAAPSDAQDIEHSKYFFYEEYSCPTNWLEPVMVYHDGDSDPHGLIEFVRSVDASQIPADEDVGPNDHDRALVALIEAEAAKNG